jgi:SpoVK/Ycf46/Vps4 family AAA+-type ATPase
MQETRKPLTRPLARGDAPQSTQDKYAVIPLPNDQWRQNGEALVLAPHVCTLLTRYGLFRVQFGAVDGGYGLLMLSGPPGTGKSDTARWAGDAIVRMLATKGNGLVINAQALFDAHLGKSARLVDELLADIDLSARRGLTCLIWEDAEGIFTGRHQSLKSNDPTDVLRVTTTLLHGLDRLRYEANVIQYATLNMHGVVDCAIASRADLTISFELPNTDERLAMLQKKLKGLAGEQILPTLATATEGWSGRDLSRITMLAFLHGTGHTPEELTEEDFLRAVGITPDSDGQEAVTEEGNYELKEEEAPWTQSSTNAFQPEASPQKSRSIWPLRLFERQRTSWSFPRLTRSRTRLTS